MSNQLTSYTHELVSQLERARLEADQRLKAPGQRIHVSEITSLPAFVYEKVRNIVDYKDEYLLRKNAIRRFLKRRIVLPKFGGDPQPAALALVRDLILARYLPNDAITDQVASGVGEIIAKYYSLLQTAAQSGCSAPRWREQVLGIAAVECDAYLNPPGERHAFTSYAYRLIKPAIDFCDATETEDIRNVQLVISIQRVLERADKDIIAYYLLRHNHHKFFSLPAAEAGAYLGPQLTDALNSILVTQNHRLGKRVLPRVKRLAAPLIVLRQTYHDSNGDPRSLFASHGRLEHIVRDTYLKLWRATKKRIRRKGFHAMAYIFLTKMLLAVLIELPYERFILGEIAIIPISINLLFPPLLMAIITLMIKSPGKQNRETMVAAVMEAAFGDEPSFYKLRRLKTARPAILRRIAYGGIYVITMGISFAALVTILEKLNFNILSGALFVFFVSLVSFFGLGLRAQARQLKVIVGRDTMSSFIVDFFTLPIVAFGKWLSTTFDRINIFVFLLDYLFEIPFKTLLKLIEDWFSFLKEKKDEMY